MTTQKQINGIMVGVVTNIEDPCSSGRVRVMIPQLGDQLSNWARIATPMAGKDRGVFLRPEVGDEVLIAFENGDLQRPCVLGGLWNGVDKPPQDDGKTKENNWRFIHSRSGHVVKLDDLHGSEKIEIISNDEGRRIVIDTSGDKIKIECDGGAVEIAAGGDVKVVGKSVSIASVGDMKLEASGKMTIKGSTVNIN